MGPLDLAEAVEDLICTFEGGGDSTMDTLAMFIFGWVVAALVVLWVGKFLYARFTQTAGKEKEKVEKASTAEDVIDSKKQKSAVTAAAPKLPSGKSGYVPPTPPLRRRLTRQSPGPDPARKSARYVPAPQCTGPDNICVLWVNDILQWLYSDHVIVRELTDSWIIALNDYMRKTAADQGISVELVRILPETNPPQLCNVFAECDSKDDVTITCDCEATPAFQLKSFRQIDDKPETSHYRVNVNKLRARLNIFCITEKLQGDIKLDGWPEIKVALAPVGNIKNNIDETELQNVIIDILINAIRNTEVHLNFSQYPQCPKLVRHTDMPGQFLPVHYDSMSRFTSTPNHITLDSPVAHRGEKRLLVKVVRAAQLGGSHGCKDPFCVIEMDEPSQRNQTSIQKNTDSPFWDEHFLLDVTRSTAEILFEIYDHSTSPHRFLGLGIVGVDELLINPSQRQIISLQSRPYESDPISGTLTVEFMFIEGADIPLIEGSQPYKIKETIKPSIPSKGPIMTSSPINHAPNNQELLLNGNHMDSDIKRNLSNHRYNLSADQNSITIHSEQNLEMIDGVWKEIETNNDNKENEDLQNSVDESEIKEKKEEVPERSQLGILSKPKTEPSDEFRGRTRKRRDFFGTIRRRLGKSKNRSKSAGPENDFGRDDSLNRSVSADRNRNNSYLNPSGQRSMEETSRRSSLSEASGLSTASGRTYINEASTLVLETLENGIKKHYLVPLSLAQKSKWKKKGIKLHIFNDHTFIAKHLSGGTTCHACGKSIARRLGKQGYECRDCQMKCHKHCHVKVNENCPTSTIHNIELSMLPVLSE